METYTEKENNVETTKYRKHYLLPDSIIINSDINLDKKREGLITFNSFLADINNEYILINNTSFRNKRYFFNNIFVCNFFVDYDSYRKVRYFKMAYI